MIRSKTDDASRSVRHGRTQPNSVIMYQQTRCERKCVSIYNVNSLSVSPDRKAASINPFLSPIIATMQQALPVFAFSYVLIRDHVLDMEDEETGLKYLKYVFDELRRVYIEVQTGTHGKSRYKDMEAPDYSHLFATDQMRVNFGAPMERYATVKMLRGLQRFLLYRLEQRLKYGFTPEEWLAVQSPLDTGGSDTGSESPHKDSEAAQSEESNELVTSIPPIPFVEDENLVLRRNRKIVKTSMADAHRDGFLQITETGVDFSLDTPMTHAKFVLRCLKEYLKCPISAFVRRFVTVHGEMTEYEKIAGKWPSSPRTRGTIRMYFQ